MVEGLAFIGARATWNLQQSAIPGAPVVPDLERKPRRRVVRPQVAQVMRWMADQLDPRGGGRTAVSH